MVEIKNFVMSEISIGNGMSRKQLSITIQTNTIKEMDEVRKRICDVLANSFNETDSYGNEIRKE